MERIHAITSSGEVLQDIAVFRKLYQAVGLGWVSGGMDGCPRRLVDGLLLEGCRCM